jgi:hypothetical protein
VRLSHRPMVSHGLKSQVSTRRRGKDTGDHKARATIVVEVSGEHKASSNGERGPWVVEQGPSGASTLSW